LGGTAHRSAGRRGAPGGARRAPVLGLAGPVPADAPRRPRRPRRRGGLRPGLVASLVLHAGFAALVVLAALTRPRPPEPLPPPSYAMYYQSGAPDRPAEPATPAPPQFAPPPEPPSPPPATPPAAPPSLPPAPPLPQQAAPPPPPPAATRLAEAAAPPAPPLRAEAPPPPTPPPPTPPARVEALPMPPPPPRQDRPQQEAAVIAPPRPARPAPQAPAERLPGLWLPDAARLAPPARPEAARPDPARRGLDLSLGALTVPGRNAPEPQVSVRGAEVGPDWRNAFRRWLDENVRYPANAAVVGDEGTNRIQLMVDPDGRVRSWRLLRRSGSVWLDAGLEMPFRNAVLPAFPPGADPKGVEVNLTVHWHIIRQ
jgi:TonB family protein